MHVDHLHRPVKMTDAARLQVWDAVWSPWGSPHAITGPAALEARFPGQWFQIESALHYNWHRHYDPTLGRYTQPDPLGFVDGPSVYGYAKARPQQLVDSKGEQVAIPLPPQTWPLLIPPAVYCYFYPAKCKKALDYICRKSGSGGGQSDDRRCETVLRGCRKGCTDVYVENPENLPGSGKNYQPRLQRCVKDCMAAHNCPY